MMRRPICGCRPVSCGRHGVFRDGSETSAKVSLVNLLWSVHLPI